MPNADLSRFDAVLTPAQRDFLVEVVAALKARGIQAELRGETAANVHAILDGEEPPEPESMSATLGVSVSRDDPAARRTVAEAIREVGERHPELVAGSSYYQGVPLSQANYPESATYLYTTLPDGRSTSILLDESHLYPSGPREEQPIAGLPLPLVDRSTAWLSVDRMRESAASYDHAPYERGQVVQRPSAGLGRPVQSWLSAPPSFDRPTTDLDLTPDPRAVAPLPSAYLAGKAWVEALTGSGLTAGRGYRPLTSVARSERLARFLELTAGHETASPRLRDSDPEPQASATGTPEDNGPTRETTIPIPPGRRRARPVPGADPYGSPGNNQAGGGVAGGPA